MSNEQTSKLSRRDLLKMGAVITLGLSGIAAKNPPIDQKPGDLSAPEGEPVERPDGKGRVLVIGENHGSETLDSKHNTLGGYYIPFNRGLEVERSIDQSLGGETPDVMIVDSMPSTFLQDSSLFASYLRDVAEYQAKRDLSPNTDSVAFHLWALGYVAKHSLHLVLADPVNISPSITNYIESEDDAFQAYEREVRFQARERRVTSDRLTKMAQSETNSLRERPEYEANKVRSITWNLIGLDILAGLGYLLYPALGNKDLSISSQSISRREFLRFWANRATNALKISLVSPLLGVLGMSASDYIKSETAISSEKEIERISAEVNQEIDLRDKNNLYGQWKGDFWKIGDQFATNSPIDPKLYETDEFKRRSELLKRMGEITFIFRNALIAEVACLPVETLTGGNKQRINIVAIMGYDHSVPKNSRISDFVRDPKNRREIIRSSLLALKAKWLADKKSGKENGLNYPKLIQELRSGSFTLDFSPDTQLQISDGNTRAAIDSIKNRGYKIPVLENKELDPET